MRKPTITPLGDGRVNLVDGPFEALVGADASPGAVEAVHRAVVARFAAAVEEIESELPLLRRAAERASTDITGPVGRRMWRAVRPFAEEEGPAPVVAARGALAEELLAAAAEAAAADRLFVSVGPSVALLLTAGFAFRASLAGRSDGSAPFGATDVRAADPVRGVAVAGRGDAAGTPGLADAVTVLAQTASKADAAAAVIAAAVDLPDQLAVRRVAPSGAWNGFGGRPRAEFVAVPTAAQAAAALEAGRARAERLLAAGLIAGAALRLDETTVSVGRAVPPPGGDKATAPRFGRRA